MSSTYDFPGLAGNEPMSEWQPIETAPKDGTEVIGCYVMQHEGMLPSMYGPWTIAFRKGRWQSSWDGARVIEYMSDWGTEYKEPDLEPTHWQPLPMPPHPQRARCEPC